MEVNLTNEQTIKRENKCKEIDIVDLWQLKEGGLGARDRL